MDDFYLDDSSTEEMRNEILCLRQENEKLRNRIAELEDEIREHYESIKIDKMPDADYLYEHHNDDDLADIEYSLYGYESEFSNGI